MNSPKVSVIVPIYKVEKYLVQCIDSIIGQTLKDIEIILVDEGDIDACRFIIDHYEQTDNRVKTIHEKNGGYGASVNKGLDIARGEYISIIESDDFIEPTMYEEMYEYAKKLDADVVKTPYYEYWDKTATEDEIIKPCFWQKWVNNVAENTLFSIKDYPVFMSIHPSIWSCIYKKSYFDKYNVRFLEDKGAYVDHHFKILSLLNTDKIAWLNKPFYKYRLSNMNASAASINLPVMIKRWNEVHKLIKEQYSKQCKYFENYNFREEFTNIYNRLRNENYSIDEVSYKTLKENLSCITFDTIKETKNISIGARLFMLLIKIFPQYLKKYIRKDMQRAYVKILGFEIFNLIKIKPKTYKVLFLNLFPMFKLKLKTNKNYKIYLFGFIPFVDMKGI